MPTNHLTADELADMLGCAVTGFECTRRYLERHGWPFELNLRGLPRVTRAYHDARLSGSASRPGARRRRRTWSCAWRRSAAACLWWRRCARVAYLTVNRPGEMRFARVMRKALSLQRTTSLYVFCNSEGLPYTTSGWNTNLRRLMDHAKKKAEKEKVEFVRFTLKDMRPAAVTDRVEEGAKRSQALPGIVAIEWCGKFTIGGNKKGQGNRITLAQYVFIGYLAVNLRAAQLLLRRNNMIFLRSGCILSISSALHGRT